MKLSDNQKVAIYASSLEGTVSTSTRVLDTNESIVERAYDIGKMMIDKIENASSDNDPLSPVADA